MEGGQEYTCFIIALWMKDTITAGISTRHSQLARILKWKGRRREVWGRERERGREGEREREREGGLRARREKTGGADRQTGRRADGARVSGTGGGGGGEKASGWHRQWNEQVIEVKWEWEQSGGKKGRGNLRGIKHGLRATEVRRQTSMLRRPRWEFPGRSFVPFPNLFWGAAAEPHTGTCEGVETGLLKTDETRCFFDAISGGQKPDFLFCPWHKGCCVVCLSSSRLFVVVGAVNN